MIQILTNQAVFVTLSVVTIPPLAQGIFILTLNQADVIGDQSDAVTQNAWFRCVLCAAISGEISILIQTGAESWEGFLYQESAIGRVGYEMLAKFFLDISKIRPLFFEKLFNEPADSRFPKIRIKIKIGFRVFLFAPIRNSSPHFILCVSFANGGQWTW